MDGLCDGSCQHEEKSFTIFDVTIQDPHGDPELDPGVAGANPTNEVTFDVGPSPTVSVSCKALPDPDTPEVRALLEDNMIRWTVTEIDGSTLSWDHAWPNDNTKGEGLEPEATFEGMPGDNNSFGLKQVKMEIMDGGQPLSEKTTNIQVFYPRDEWNHPDGVDRPNWFYYWSQVYHNDHVSYDAGLNGSAKTPGMTDWDYSVQPDKDDIIIGNRHPGSFPAYGGDGRLFSGIDRFIATVIHEETHVDQIQRVDPLVPSSGNDSFRYGWSWNTWYVPPGQPPGDTLRNNH